MAESGDFKEVFNEARLRRIAAEFAAVASRFDRKRFLACALDGHEGLVLSGRIRRISEALRQAMPGSFRRTLRFVRAVAARTEPGFSTLYLPDYVGRYGLEAFDQSMEVLREMTHLGSSEFGVRPFLMADLGRALAAMRQWAEDEDHHVRRLASEGSRPRLPWASRLEALVKDPSPTLPILEVLKEDTSPYVRKSVANHLNDISKDHPDVVLRILRSWDLQEPGPAWICRHALRTLIKAGDRSALKLVGAGRTAKGRVQKFAAAPRRIRLGESVTLEAVFVPEADGRLVIDYAVHYVKSSGQSSRKVFKWRVVEGEGGREIRLSKRQVIRDFTTRRHYPGRHPVELVINGEVKAQAGFYLIA